MRRSVLRNLLAAGLLFAIAATAQAEDVATKWRLSLAVGAYDGVHGIESPAANELRLFNESLDQVARWDDPRNDSNAFGQLDLKSGPLVTFGVQYALTKIFIIEGSVGYSKADLGDVGLDVQFSGNTSSVDEIAFNFDSFRVSAGEIERVPFQLTAIARFRPRAKFHPYFGAGIGYSINGYTPSDDFNTLSLNMDSATGEQLTMTPQADNSTQAIVTIPGETIQDLDGALVNVRDTFEWHLVAGAELSLKRKWSIYGDIRWVDASREIELGFNGSDELGVSVPNFNDFVNSPVGRQFTLGEGAGPVQILDGGLIDAGQRVAVPQQGIPQDYMCQGEIDPLCETLFFYDPAVLNKEPNYTDPRLPADFEPNGELDPGQYYVQGGTFSTDGFSFQIGVRYTF
jgi:opacity protein-like surface antigen